MRFVCTLLPLVGIKAALAAALVSAHGVAPEPYFEANRGQADSSVAFVARGPGYAVLLQRDGSATYRFSGVEKGAPPLRIRFLGRHAPAGMVGELPLAAVTNYYGGRSDGWLPAVPHFRRARFHGIYPGIDLVWRSRGAALEYEFAARAGADPRRIHIRFTGADRVSVDGQGNLVLETPAGTIQHRRPVAWQEFAGRRYDVRIALRLEGTTVGFQLGPYDHHQPLRIDPVVAYSTYVGGAGFDAGYGIAVDGSGGVYMTGTTGSIGFPAAGSGVNANDDLFVTKFNENGQLLYNTILAGNGNTSGQAIAVDSAGNAYVAGTTEASNFPVTPAAWQKVFGGVADAFAAKLNPTGQLVYATYIGGMGQETGTGIAIDPSGNAYISGYTSSVFPTTASAAQRLYGGGFSDAFLVKLNALGSAALYSTLLGGTGNDLAEAVVVDAAGHACIAGYTDSSNLAVQSAVQPSPGGEGDALVACLAADGTAWTAVTYLGGSNLDQAFALAIDPAGNLYVAGATFSQDFPATAGVFQPANAGGYDAFIAKLSPGGASLVYATYLGGNGSDAALAVAAGSAGDLWIGGYTLSTNFPLAGAWQSVAGGSFDGFVSHLSADATVLLTSSYLGGAGDDRVLGIASDPAGLVFATGSTLSTNFPVTIGAMQAAASEGMNAFLSNIGLSAETISGQVTLGGNAMSGVTLTLSGSQTGAITTDASGNYGFIVPAGGTYTVTAGSIFSPPSVTFDNLTTNQIANFSNPCTYSVGPSAPYLDATNQAGPVVSITAGPGCAWTAAASDFITITSGATGAGNGTVAFSVSANSSGALRTGTLTIAGQTVAVTQRATAGIFADVPPPAYYFDYAGIMHQTGITAGCSQQPLDYCPNSTTTRGEMAVFLIVAIEGAHSFTYTTTPYFVDVPPGNPYFKFVQKLRDLGITSGCTATKYCPDDSVTRAEMAVFIISSRYGTAPYSYPSSPYFTDVPPSNPFFRFVQKMAQVGITSGCGPGLFCPNATLIRGQMAVFIVTGLLNQLLPAGTPLIASATPDSSAAGQMVTVTLNGMHTHFVQGTTQVAATAGIVPSSITVLSGTSLTVQLAIGANVAPNATSIVVTTGAEEAVLPNGFLVQ